MGITITIILFELENHSISVKIPFKTIKEIIYNIKIKMRIQFNGKKKTLRMVMILESTQNLAF